MAKTVDIDRFVTIKNSVINDTNALQTKTLYPIYNDKYEKKSTNEIKDTN